MLNSTLNLTLSSFFLLAFSRYAGSAFLILRRHLSLVVASSGVRPSFFHVIFDICHPCCQRPTPPSFLRRNGKALPHYMVSGLRIICPYHLSLVSVSFSVIGTTLKLPPTYSLRTLSLMVTPPDQRSMRISVVCSFCSWVFLVAHVSLP